MKRYNMLNGMDRGRTGLEINKFGQIDNWIQVTLSIQCSATIETFITPEGHSYHRLRVKGESWEKLGKVEKFCNVTLRSKFKRTMYSSSTFMFEDLKLVKHYV